MCYFYSISGDNNVSELAGSHNGEVYVKAFDWTKWLEKVFKKMDNILTYQYFKLDSREPGVVQCFKTLTSDPVRKCLTKIDNPMKYLTTTTPDVITPEGLSDQRKAYLFNQIREFCKIGTEDYVAPDPNVKRPRK